ncbi:tRNA (uracil-5-)-methyltransferase homolog A-like isoform X2 [Hydractinia symbiolongicarpus]|uniref:tRNA (uracil-5-)-methyltransferase homolog A-like isoform X2 n=1 Tax=Hydractinia symbiolongicarpus TaxID=13093 RepID=UPI00254C670F|nr:tRNA (uracil-5-)-methyltransferase homolog A-like isoform X2 [Hydractinia symbiolongicarpus]
MSEVQVPSDAVDCKTIEATDLISANVNQEKVDFDDVEKNDDKTNVTCSEEQSNTNAEKLLDEYHYVKSGEYTSEMFKVVVQNLPQRISYGRFRQTILNILGFIPKKVKYNPRNNYAFLAFKDESDRQKGMQLLDNYKWKENTLHCKKAAPAKDPFVRENKRKAQQNQECESGSKKSKVSEEDDGLSPEERILHVVCPYAKYTYEEQLELKEREMSDCISNLTFKMRKENPKWMREREQKLCLDLLPIEKSPIIEYYRNKVEFTIGVGPDGKDNTIGFRLGSYREGSMLIVEPVKCINSTKESIAIAKEFQTYLQSLPHPSYNLATHIGFWQQLTVRTCTTGNIMLIIQVNSSYLEKEKYDALVSDIIRHVASAERVTKVSSIYISSSTQKNNNIDTFDLVYGDTHVTEKLLGLQFRISPNAFFQVNTPAAEILYKIVRDWCDIDQDDSCVLDVCCGTGTIGLCVANNTSLPVIGVEISKQAVEDAKHNATVNGIENARFVCGPAEKVLQDEIRKIHKKHIIAIVDPPRAGLHRTVLQLLRACTAITKVIYVSCSVKQATDNFISLCRPASKRFHGIPFKTNRAVPVDLFPQTPHCELVVELERITERSKSNSDTEDVKPIKEVETDEKEVQEGITFTEKEIND